MLVCGYAVGSLENYVNGKMRLSFIPSFCSEHTDCIVAEDSEVAEVFLHLVNRCCVLLPFCSLLYDM